MTSRVDQRGDKTAMHGLPCNGITNGNLTLANLCQAYGFAHVHELRREWHENSSPHGNIEWSDGGLQDQTEAGKLDRSSRRELVTA